MDFMLDERTTLTKEEKWVDGQALKDFGIGVKDKINKSTETKLDKGDVSEEYNTAKKIEDKIKGLTKNDIIGTINNEATLNQAKGNGWYKVNDYQINGMYGYGFLYAYTHEQTTQQIYFSHRAGIAWRQDWNSNISSATWQKIGGDLSTKLDKGSYVGTAQDLKNEIDTKANRTDLNSKLDKGGYTGTAQDIVTLLQKQVGLKFDMKLLYLNDNGQKQKDYAYFDKLMDGIFKCKQTTTTTINNSSIFENISNNSLLLTGSDSVEKEYKIEVNKTITQSYTPISVPENYMNDYNFIQIVYNLRNVTSEYQWDTRLVPMMNLKNNREVTIIDVFGNSGQIDGGIGVFKLPSSSNLMLHTIGSTASARVKEIYLMKI